ncbi:MAG: beta-glucuronidase [Solirubrobacteraceae bacterium]|nr:beta-glucuronidase [Solirubrobacteraceae bacterium]
MRRLIAAAVLLTAWPAVAGAEDGPAGGRSLDAGWQFRRAGTTTWRSVRVPFQWNAHDDSVASMLGGVGFFRTTVGLPAGSAWRLRFGSVSGRARVTVDGAVAGRHRGAFLPFEVPVAGGRHRVVVRVDSRRRRSDFPPKAEVGGLPGGGWWNASGILRDVTARPVRGPVDLRELTVLPRLPCPTCAADVVVRGVLANDGRAPAAATLRGTVGAATIHDPSLPDAPFAAPPVTVPPGASRTVTAHVAVEHPDLWSPAAPNLNTVTATAGATTWRVHTGIRSITVDRGRLLLNGAPLRLHGVGYHEETRARGMAITQGDRRRLMNEAQALGANVMRTHYPPGPALEALADRRGMLLWSEIPVYTVHDNVLARPAVRRRAVALARDNIVANGSHPSILVWSLGNELGSPVGPGQAAYLRAAARAAHALDPTRPVGLATKAYRSSLCQRAYAPLDVLGLNEYFGWYYASSPALSDFLDRAHRCYPRKALIVTEFGAEANRPGPPTEKGTYAFQKRFVAYHLGVFASKPWLNGALYWALREFRVRPGWSGGNPKPSPPLHKKGLLTWGGAKKPAWRVVHRAYAADAR